MRVLIASKPLLPALLPALSIACSILSVVSTPKLTGMLYLSALITKIEKARIAYSRHHIVKIVAVSKNASLEAIQHYYNCSQRAFGENKVQDLKTKMHSLEHLPLEWHMIGSLQEDRKSVV